MIKVCNFVLPAVTAAILAGMAFAPSPAALAEESLHVEEVTPETFAVPGRVIVKFRSSVSRLQRSGVHGALNARFLRALDDTEGVQVVAISASKPVMQAVAEYQSRPEVEWAEPDYVVSVDAIPNDPQFGTQWALDNRRQAGGLADADIDAPEAWNLAVGSSGVVVMVVDTGIDYTHPDLTSNMFRNAADCDGDRVDDDGNGWIDDCHGIDTINHDSNPADDNSHGTHVAGTIGARGNNGVGVVGVNHAVSLVGCKSLGARGSGATSYAVECLRYAGDLKRHGVNLVAINASWSGSGYSQALADAIEALRAADVLFVAAAGNLGGDNDRTPRYPASYQIANVIAVAATDSADALAGWSNFGARTVHLGAPGVSIGSTVPGGRYGAKSGTSMAAPHVTGAAALLRAYAPGLGMAGLKRAILTSGDAVPSLAGRTTSGRRLNAFNALSQVTFIPKGPFAFGVVNADGTRASGTTNWSVTYNTLLRRYEITFHDASYSSARQVTEVTPVGEARACRTGSSSGRLVVTCSSLNGTAATSRFGFVTYQP